MGKNNSSEKCVRPLMRKILEDIPNNLVVLLNCLEIDGKPKNNFNPLDFADVKNIDHIFYNDEDNKKEMKLRQSECYMKKLVETLCDDNIKRKYSQDNNKSKGRNWFYSADDNTRDEIAAEYIKSINKFYSNSTKDIVSRNVWSFEGNTQPDIFIETDKYIIVGEGKWTEGKRTSSTTHLKNRDQMIRHLQGAIEYRRNHKVNSKAIIGFYIVDACDKKSNKFPATTEAFKDIISEEDIPMDDEQLLVECFYGYTDWNTLHNKFDIVFSERQ